MKTENVSALVDDIAKRRPIRIYIDNDDFGIHEWNEETGRYEAFLGFTIEELIKILKTPNHNIKIERVSI